MAARKATRKRSAGKESGGPETLALDREAVRYWRLQRGWTQEALASQRAEVDGQPQTLSYAQIRRIEADGRCGPTSARILSALLDVPLSRLSPRDHRHLPCGLPREPSADFVGRETELKSVVAALQGRGSVRIAASIEGLPGIGKTELALQVAGWVERERSFRVFWFDAEDPDLTSTWADVVAPHLGLEGEKPEQRASAALRALQSLGEPVLLILDNVEEWSASRPWPRPRGRHIRWLVTTRRSELGGREFQHIDVPVLERAAAERLMLQIAGEELASRPGFESLLDLLGGYTIAVELAATFLRRFPEVDPEEYRRDLEAGRGDELEEEVGNRTFYGHTLERALELLWDRLPPKIRQHWLLAAQFAQAPATAALSDACGLDRRARAALRDYHLIATHSTRGWSMHRLVRAFGRKAGTAEQREEGFRALLRGTAALAREMDPNSGLERYSPDRDHYLRALEGDAGGSSALDRIALQTGIANAEMSLGDYSGAQARLELALRSAEQACPGSAAVFEIQTYLGAMLRRAGQLAESRRLLEAALERATSVLGDEHEVVSALRNNLSVACQELGDFARAKELGERALRVALATFGETHREVAVRRLNLANVLRDLGELDGAKGLLELALASDVETFGEKSPQVARTLSRLGLVLRDLGDWPGARELLERALENDLEFYGQLHPMIAMHRSQLAVVLRDLGEYEHARSLLEAVLQWDLQQSGEGHPDVAITRANLALVHRAQGDLSEARRLLEQALESDQASFGTDHPRVASYRHRLGMVLCAQGDLEAARVAIDVAIDSERARLGDGHPTLAARRSDLAAVLDASGEQARAQRLLEEALECQERALPAHHSALAITRARLASVLQAAGQGAAATVHARDALSVARALPERWEFREFIEAVAARVFGSEGCS